MKPVKGPFLTTGDNQRAPMVDMVVALLPALGFACYFYGLRVLILAAVSVGGCVLFEFLYRWLLGKPRSIQDGSAAVTGLLLAFCMPAAAPYWLVLFGDFVAIVLVKQLFGGLGHNFLNPALAARVVLAASFPKLMNTWAAPMQHLPLSMAGADAVTAATPLAYLQNDTLPAAFTLRQMLLGLRPGALGESAALMLILGGVFLLMRRVIRPRVPLCYLGTVAVLAFLFPMGNDRLVWTAYQLLSGGLLLGAIFMATDYVTNPITPRGQVLFGVGCGVLTVLVRYYGSYPEGVCAAILVMNATCCMLDRVCMPRPFGFPKRKWRLRLEEWGRGLVRRLRPGGKEEQG